MSGWGAAFIANWCRKTSPPPPHTPEYWQYHIRGRAWNCIRRVKTTKRSRKKQGSMNVSLFLCSWVWMCYDQMYQELPFMTTLQWWTRGWVLKLNKYFPPLCWFCQGFYHSNRNEVEHWGKIVFLVSVRLVEFVLVTQRRLQSFTCDRHASSSTFMRRILSSHWIATLA